MGRDVGIADRVRRIAADYQLPVDVFEVAGWRDRGSASFAPRGSVGHHTAGPASGETPSLNICIHGRRDLPGPLCNIYQGRETNGRIKVFVVAAGRANHAGSGGWRGLSGNSAVFGIEVENTGSQPWTLLELHVSACLHAALLEGTPGRDPELFCMHKEWAPRRKPDMHTVEGANMRALVRDRLARVGVPGSPAPAPAPSVPSPDEAAIRRWCAGVTLNALNALGPRTVYGMGDRGGGVRALQDALNIVASQGLEVDGEFRPATDRAVRNVQRFFGLAVDGSAGSQTLNVLRWMLTLIRDGRA